MIQIKIILLFIFSVTNVLAQGFLTINPSSLSLSRTYNEQTQQTEYELSSYEYGNKREHIYGTSNPALYKYYNYHTVYKFNLNSIPSNAYNIKAYLNAHRGSWSSGNSIIVSVPDNLNFNNYTDCWEAADEGSELFQVDLETDVYHDITSSVVSRLSQGYINFGARESDYSLSHYGYINRYLYIEYDTPKHITIDNNFVAQGGGNHGSIKIDGVTRPAPYSVEKNLGQNLALEAISPQTDNQGHQVVWAGCEQSFWDRNGTWKSYDQTYSFTVAADDHEKTYTANFQPVIVTTSGTLSSNETWFTNVSLSDAVFVPSGVTLTITSCATVSLNGNPIISTGGTIIRESESSTINGLAAYIRSGSTLKGLVTSIQQGINYASSGESINLFPLTFNESPSFSSKSGITINGFDAATINGGITVTNSDNIVVQNVNVANQLTENNSSYTFLGANMLGSTALLDYGSTATIIVWTYAPNIGASFGVISYNGTGEMGSTDIMNGDLGVFLSSNASYYIGNSNTFCNNGYDIYTQNGAYALAGGNTYSSILYTTLYGNVEVDQNYMYMDDVCSLTKAVTSDNNRSDLILSSELQSLDKKYTQMLNRIIKDKKENKYDVKNYIKEFDQLIIEYGKSFNEKSNKQIAKAALSKISHLYKGKNDKKGFYNFIAQSLADSKLNSFKPYLKRYLIWESVDNKQFENSLAIADEVLVSDISEDLQAEMLYEKGIIYKNYLNDFEKAEAMFSEIMDKYPQNLLSRFAALELGIEPIKIELNNKQENSEESNDSETIVNGLSDAFPNPFNPKTIINYSLAEKGYVSIKVFDILGSELAELVNEVKDAGKHTVQFNASNLPSGVYIYSIQVNNPAGGGFKATRKMILAK